MYLLTQFSSNQIVQTLPGALRTWFGVNRKYNRFGHLFQGRYKAFIVDAVYLSKVLSGKRNADIGTAFGITIQAVTNAARDVEKMREGDGRFNSELKRIKEIVGDSKQSV